jgi:uncharacterized membrane protein
VITVAILKMLVFVLVGVLSILPTVPVPDWLTGADSAIGTVFQDAGLMSVWFPIGLATTILVALGGIWLAGLAVKFARIVISLMTGGGGGAA